jgi:hypothetical protein
MDKTYIMEFYPKDATNIEKKISYHNEIIPSTMELKLLGLILHDTISWKSHISKLNKACYIA